MQAVSLGSQLYQCYVAVSLCPCCISWCPAHGAAHVRSGSVMSVEAHTPSSLVGVGLGWGAVGRATHISLFCPLLIHMTSPRASVICVPRSQGEFCVFHTICTKTSHVKFHLSHFGKYGPGLRLVSWKDFLVRKLPVHSLSSGSSGGWRLEAFSPYPSLRHLGPNVLTSTHFLIPLP